MAMSTLYLQIKKMRERNTYRNQTHTRRITIPIHLPLFFPIQQIIVILHTNKLSPAMLLRHELHLRKLSCPHAARADIADFPRLDEVMQGFHGLFDWDIGVEAVDLEDVEIRRVQASQGSFYSCEYGLARETWLVSII